MIDRLCQGVRPVFSDLLDGETIPPLRRVAARLHLTFCPMCRRYQRSLEATREALAALRAPGDEDESA
jgi:predicted anti-sigma-YlaC factor YlaD